MFGLFIVFKNPPVNCHSTLIWQYLSRACPKTICSAHFVASLCRTLCRTVRFLAIFDKVRRQSARQRSRASFVGQALVSCNRRWVGPCPNFSHHTAFASRFVAK